MSSHRRAHEKWGSREVQTLLAIIRVLKFFLIIKINM